MFKTTQLIAEHFKEKNLKFFLGERDGHSAVEMYATTEVGRRFFIRFITDRDAGANMNQVLIRVFDFADIVPRSREIAVLRACNDMNNSAAYLRFFDQ